MLPFLKNKKDTGGIASVIIKNRAPDAEPQENQEDSAYSLEDCGNDILDAIKMDDAKGLAQAIKELMNTPDEAEETPMPHSLDASLEPET